MTANTLILEPLKYLEIEKFEEVGDYVQGNYTVRLGNKPRTSQPYFFEGNLVALVSKESDPDYPCLITKTELYEEYQKDFERLRASLNQSFDKKWSKRKILPRSYRSL